MRMTGPVTTLFVLAHAGGNAAMYTGLLQRLAGTARPVPLDLPGHGSRIGEPLLTTIPAMADDVRKHMEAALRGAPDARHAVFGHSLGGLLAFLASAGLEKAGRPPCHVFISSGCLPGRHYAPENLHTMSDEQLWAESARYFGGIPREAVMSDELRTLFMPLLRADLTAVVNHAPARVEAVDFPITAMHGDRDVVEAEDMDLWRRMTTGAFRRHCVEGGHFHVLRAPEQAARVIASALAPEESGTGGTQA